MSPSFLCSFLVPHATMLTQLRTPSLYRAQKTTARAVQALLAPHKLLKRPNAPHRVRVKEGPHQWPIYRSRYPSVSLHDVPNGRPRMRWCSCLRWLLRLALLPIVECRDGAASVHGFPSSLRQACATVGFADIGKTGPADLCRTSILRSLATMILCFDQGRTRKFCCSAQKLSM